LNAVLTFQEWLEDFATPETRLIGETIIQKEIAAVNARVPTDFTPGIQSKLLKYHDRIKKGERDLCF
jgi:2-iminoacetate synthase